MLGRKDRWVVSPDSRVRLPVRVIKYRDLDVPEKLDHLDAFSLRAPLVADDPALWSLL